MEPLTTTSIVPAPAITNLCVNLDQDAANRLRDLIYLTGRTKRELVSNAILSIPCDAEMGTNG